LPPYAALCPFVMRLEGNFPATFCLILSPAHSNTEDSGRHTFASFECSGAPLAFAPQLCDAFHDERNRKAMAEIVPSKIRYSGTLHSRLPPVLDIANRFAGQLTFKMGKDVRESPLSLNAFRVSM
jgi:hypothetical protein